MTGGAGFIGSNFVQKTVVERPHLKITVLDSLTYAGSLENLHGAMDRIQFVHGDIRDKVLVSRLVADSDVVIHFAAESHNDNSLRDPILFVDVNVLGTLNIIEACVKFGVRMHHVSTDEVFGDLPTDSEDEFSVDTPYKPSSPYSASKAASDHLVRAWIRSFGLLATISNCSNNYGIRQHPEKLIPATIKRIISGKRPVIYGSGENVRDWIHVDDHTDGIWTILEKGAIGSTYLLGANNRVKNIELVSEILRIAHLPPDYVEFIQDRPGHDRRYAIDASSSRKLGWSPKKTDIFAQLPELVEFYSQHLSMD